MTAAFADATLRGMWPLAALYLVLVAPVELDPVQQARRALAGRLHEEGRPAEAAAELEALIAEVGPLPDLLYDAGQSRMAASHPAHAWRHFQALLATPRLSPDDREAGVRRLRAAEQASTAVEVKLPESAGEARVVARRVEARATRPPLEAKAVGGVATLRLDPGPWDISVEGTGAATSLRRVDVGALPVTVVWTVAAAPAPRRVGDPGRPFTLAGAVLTPLGFAGTLGLAGLIPAYQRTGSAFTRLREELELRSWTDTDVAALEGLSREARRERAAIVTISVLSGALIATGVGLLIHGQRRARTARLSWRFVPTPGGALLTGSF